MEDREDPRTTQNGTTTMQHTLMTETLIRVSVLGTFLLSCQNNINQGNLGKKEAFNLGPMVLED